MHAIACMFIFTEIVLLNTHTVVRDNLYSIWACARIISVSNGILQTGKCVWRSLNSS